jgi:hypothetical protein
MFIQEIVKPAVFELCGSKDRHTTSERKDICRRRMALHSMECCGKLKSHADENSLESHVSSLSFLILS